MARTLNDPEHPRGLGSSPNSATDGLYDFEQTGPDAMKIVNACNLGFAMSLWDPDPRVSFQSLYTAGSERCESETPQHDEGMEQWSPISLGNYFCPLYNMAAHSLV